MRSDNIPEHGGAVLNSANGDILDLSANLNPLGIPENVRTALSSSVGDWERYPDHDCAELCEKLAERLGVSSSQIVCGNGAADLIYRIISAYRPKRALIAVPCFSEYEKALREYGAEILEYPLSENSGFAIEDNFPNVIGERLSGGDMLILASPNNPTGRVIPRDILQNICAECAKRGVLFLCDECFMGFTENAASSLEFMNSCVIKLSAFTKTFALAGVRLGYAVFGGAGIAETAKRRGQYWSVSAPAQTAGIAALEACEEYLEKTRHLISEQRKFLTNELSGLGIKVFPSDANFLLLKTEIPLYDELYKRGIIIRRCGNFGWLDDRFYRIAVRTEEENARLLAAVKEIING